MKPNRTLVALCAVSLVLSLTTGCGYNTIQTQDEEINNKWAMVQTQLQRRTDLVPNLVKVVKGYAKHEETVFKDIADARAKMSGAVKSGDPGKVNAAEGEFNGALSRLLVVAENYPNLKADAQYTRLMDELAGTENRISVSRMDYNNTVRDYNRNIRQFPNNLTASVIGAKKHSYYNAPESSQQAPQVDMD